MLPWKRGAAGCWKIQREQPQEEGLAGGHPHRHPREVPVPSAQPLEFLIRVWRESWLLLSASPEGQRRSP